MCQARVYELARPLSGSTYRDVFRLAAESGNHGLLVMRDQLAAEDSATEFLDALKPFKTERSDRWPGTVLFAGAGLATLHHFALNDAALVALKEAADSIYAWRQPALPEDLCALRSDDTTWLGSVAHESDAWLELTPDEHAVVTAALPDLLKP
jgi:hypothetical protein